MITWTMPTWLLLLLLLQLCLPVTTTQIRSLFFFLSFLSFLLFFSFFIIILPSKPILSWRTSCVYAYSFIGYIVDKSIAVSFSNPSNLLYFLYLLFSRFLSLFSLSLSFRCPRTTVYMMYSRSCWSSSSVKLVVSYPRNLINFSTFFLSLCSLFSYLLNLSYSAFASCISWILWFPSCSKANSALILFCYALGF